MSFEKHWIEIPGTPVPQPRHSVSARGEFVRVYIPKSHPVHEYKRRIAEYTDDWPVFVGPLNVVIELAFPMPQSWSYKKQAAMREAWHTQKPDVDNVAKAILDALKDRWRDDTQVARLTVDKRWTDCKQGHTWLEILELT